MSSLTPVKPFDLQSAFDLAPIQKDLTSVKEFVGKAVTHLKDVVVPEKDKLIKATGITAIVAAVIAIVAAIIAYIFPPFFLIAAGVCLFMAVAALGTGATAGVGFIQKRSAEDQIETCKDDTKITEDVMNKVKGDVKADDKAAQNVTFDKLSSLIKKYLPTA